MIDVSPAQLQIIKEILKRHAPQAEARAFGSRVKWTAKDHSDLDLAVVDQEKLSFKKLATLKNAFEESDLPFRVDVLDWRAISPEFQKVIEGGYEVIQKRGLVMSSNEWKKYKLGELGKLARGKSKHRPRDAAFLYGGPYPFIQTGDIKSANHKIYKYSQTYSEAGLAQSKLWSEGTIAITIAANIADTSILTFPACFPDSVLGFVADKEKCDVDFMEYLLRYYKKQIQSHAVGSVQDNINLGTFENVEFDIPPLPTQHRIADILSALDEKIELNRQTNATLEAIAQSIFREWFVEFSFPGATGNMVESELGMIPQKWKTGTLEEIVTNYDSKRIPLSSREREKRKGIYPYYGAASIVDYIDDFLFDGVYLLMGEDGTVITEDEKPVLQYVSGKFWVNNHTHVLQGKGNFSTEFVYLVLKNTNIKHIVTGAVQPKINQGNMNRLPLVIPDKETLKAFQEVIKPTFAYILENEQQSKTLMSLRDTLLPKLMSGEIEVIS